MALVIVAPRTSRRAIPTCRSCYLTPSAAAPDPVRRSRSFRRPPAPIREPGGQSRGGL